MVVVVVVAAPAKAVVAEGWGWGERSSGRTRCGSRRSGSSFQKGSTSGNSVVV